MDCCWHYTNSTPDHPPAPSHLTVAKSANFREAARGWPHPQRPQHREGFLMLCLCGAKKRKKKTYNVRFSHATVFSMPTTYPPSGLRPQEDQAQTQEGQDGHLEVLYTSGGEIKCLCREYPPPSGGAGIFVGFLCLIIFALCPPPFRDGLPHRLLLL
ncbi:hypothetical protein DFH08DRAFT_396586 [Mycena albidolilacea]|uniref:Uncharacterized protein n=1 Tax=Mycena albidolilacea TaxID=1033008 RepID=A0AAD6ZEB1_9AGAR|nr:hypothetical protein DFH08DRAFT_396586 [Mycena albidolilacea]